MTNDKDYEVAGVGALHVCPFCNLRFGVCYDAKNTPNGLIHEEPQCDKFRDLDALDYVVAVNNANGVKRN